MANVNGQEVGVDCDETFSPSCCPTDDYPYCFGSAVSRHWSLHQFDVKNAFLSFMVIYKKLYTCISHLDLLIRVNPNMFASSVDRYIVLSRRLGLGIKDLLLTLSPLIL